MKRKRIIIIIIISLLALITILFSNKVLNLNHSHSKPKDLDIAFGFSQGMYHSKGYPLGFHNNIINKLASDTDITVRMHNLPRDTSLINGLIENKFDIVIFDSTDSIDNKYSEKLASIDNFPKFKWYYSKDRIDSISFINEWLDSYLISEDFNNTYNQYMELDKSRYISPYDEIVKKYSKKIGWDWRLVSAIIYKESRFYIGAKSHRAALGLMQIKQSTASYLGIDDISSAENNIKAGVTYIEYLNKRNKKYHLDSLNNIKFILASYNAGGSRISDCMNFTKALGKNSLDWDSVAANIPLMVEEKYYLDTTIIKLGKFKGDETVNYVSTILATYDKYQEKYP